MRNLLVAMGLWLLSRLLERSTWLGAAGLVASLSFLPHAQEDAQFVAALGALVCSVAAIVHREKGSLH